MRRIMAAVSLLALVACGGSGDGGESTSVASVSPTPTASPLREQTVGCDPAVARRQADGLADRLTEGNLDRVIDSQDLIALPIAYAQVEGKVVADLEENGPFEGGEECLVAFAESKEKLNAALALATGGQVSPMFDDREVAKTWQALLTYYPDTEHRLDAENSLTELGYSIPGEYATQRW